MSGVKREPEESGSSASRHSQQQHYYQQPPSSSPYTSSSSSSAASHHPSHQHSMPAPASDPNAMDSDQPPHSSAPSGPTYTLPPLPELEEYLAHVHPQHFRTFLPQVDLYDFKASKLPLARIKKIMKSDEDVRMISAEAPVLFAKACELFIMDLTLRAWSRVDHCKRHTIQKNDVAAVIQSAELFDFLHQIVPIGALDPDEEGSPAHHPISSLDEENARFRSNVPDVLLERPLHDPYDDSLPPMHTQTTVLRQQMSREHASGSYRSTGSAPPMDDDAREVLLSPITPGPPLLPRVGLMHQQVIMQQQQEQQNNSAASLPTPNEYGMTSMSRGISTEGTVGGGSMSTPNFNADISGSSSDLENTPQSHAANTFNNPNLPSVLTPLTPMLSNMPPQTPNPNYYPPQQMHHQQRQQLQQQQLQPQPSPNLIPQTPLTSFATPGGVGTSSFDMPPSPGLVGANSVPVGGAPPGVVPSTPSSLSLNTPNFQAGYQPDGSTEEEMEAQEE